MAAKKFSYAGVAGEMNTNMKTIVELQGEAGRVWSDDVGVNLLVFD